MTTTAQSIIYEAQRALNDRSGVRASAADLVKLLNRAQRDIALVRPDTTNQITDFTCVAGAKQTLPADAQTLIDIPYNVSAPKQSAISKVNQSTMDAVLPDWRTAASKTEAQHYMYDLRNPRVFWIYPPVLAGVKVALEAARYPQDIAAPGGSGKEASSVVGNISLADEWSTALLAATLWYAYMTDLEGIGNADLAALYKTQAEQILGTQLQSSMVAQRPEKTD